MITTMQKLVYVKHTCMYINDIIFSQQREVYPVRGMKSIILCRKHLFGKARMLVLQWKW